MSASRPAGLGRLRLRLTAWYVATFGVILLLLGGGLFLVVRHQLARQLDDSLRDATAELERAARIREMEASAARGQVVDAVEELRIPDRTLFLLDAMGRPVKPASAPDWLVALARDAEARGEVNATRRLRHEHHLRVHAERFRLGGGATMVAVATADEVELEDRYAALIVAFGGAALVALVLVAGGGWLLVRKSTAPVERTMEHMRRFMADAAHELRTPIAVLRSRAEVALQRSRGEEGYVVALRGIEAESLRLGRIVDDLLMLARADADERPVERARLFLDDVVADAAAAAGAMAQAKGVAVDVEEFEEAAVIGDAALLRQLAMILLDNAIKFTEPGGHVSVRVGMLDGRPTLVVADTGRGIGAEQLPRIFDRFYRGDAARTRGAAAEASTGAGLGLSIARWIAEAHGASIRVASETGSGTRVSVDFPPAPPAAPATPRIEPRPVATSG
jgi:signal transduction histidine kinase